VEVAAFLSDEWIVALDAVARASELVPSLPDGGRLVVEQQVSDTPGGSARFHLVFDANGARVIPGGAEEPDLVLITDYATACSLHRGETNAQQALGHHRLKVRGNLTTIARRAAVLGAVSDLFASVRSQTSFADDQLKAPRN
jgi:putative sterol carrier protein